MRVVNDKQDPIEVKSVDIFALISQMFLVSLGVATWVFCPMVMVVTHCRFTNPWSKLASLGGAILALLFLEVPLSQVLLGFVVSLVVADLFDRQVKPFQLLVQALLVALIAALGCLYWGAVGEHLSVGQFWMHWVAEVIDKLKSTNALEGAVNWVAIKELILYEGPFLYLSASLLSFWIALGSAAHFGWVKEETNVYSSKSLKALRLPRWMNPLFALFFALTLIVTSPAHYAISGVFRVLSGFLFIQGSICLSIVLEQRGVRKNIRTLIYCLSVLLGFYALVGMGMMSPWILRKRREVSPQISLSKLEEQT
jgi:Predicted membrane protein (DUF2232)